MTANEIRSARERIAGVVRVTPSVPAVCPVTESSLHLKLENMQRTGSFKERGALNKLLLLRKAGAHKGIIAASAGNHAQAVSYHGARLGFDVTLVMPKHTPLNKITACQRWGAHVQLEGESFFDAMSIAQERAKAEGLALVHAFDDPEVIAGQGTAGLEILEQNPDVDLVLIPVGGGGLASGIATAVKEKKPKCRVVGIQAENYSQVLRAYRGESPKPIDKNAPPTIGDGVAIKNIGEVTLPLLKKYLDDIVAVTEEEMANAILFLLESSKVLAEGAGSAGFAALMAGKVKPGSSTVAVVSGGNIDVTLISRIIEKGLVKSHRLVRLSVVIPDRPGGLRNLAGLLADAGANIQQIQHERASEQIPLYTTGTDLTLQTRGQEHIDEVVAILRQHGYKPEIKN